MNGDSVKKGEHPSVALHIEELVLHAPVAADPTSVGEAVQRGLTRLLSSGTPLTTEGFARTSLDGGALHVGAGSGAEAIGEELAKAIHGALFPVARRRDGAFRKSLMTDRADRDAKDSPATYNPE